ncbi:MAG: hypothetical protein AB1333_04850 [Patescibacteria group bacterium]
MLEGFYQGLQDLANHTIEQAVQLMKRHPELRRLKPSHSDKIELAKLILPDMKALLVEFPRIHKVMDRCECDYPKVKTLRERFLKVGFDKSSRSWFDYEHRVLVLRSVGVIAINFFKTSTSFVKKCIKVYEYISNSYEDYFEYDLERDTSFLSSIISRLEKDQLDMDAIYARFHCMSGRIQKEYDELSGIIHECPAPLSDSLAPLGGMWMKPNRS